MKVIKLTFLLIIIYFLTGCEEQIDWPLSNEEANVLVVESVLTNEVKNHLIKLSKPYNKQNQTSEKVSGALVAILTETDTVFATESPVGSGMYYTDTMSAVVDKLYILGIQYNGKTYFAFGAQPPVEPFTSPLEYRLVGENSYTINFRESGSNPNYIKYLIDWQNVGNCSDSIDCKAKQIFYDLKNIDINEQFKPTQERVIFPAGTIIIRKKFSVSPRYKEYLRGMLSETAWRGGLFDSFPANAATNLSEGAVGFFAVSTVLSDTTVIQ